MSDGSSRIGGVILAAGAGERFGGLKQLAELHGMPLLQHSIDALAAVDGVGERVVVLGAQAGNVARSIEPGPVRVVECKDWRQGLSASLRTGLAALGDVDWAVIMLGDQPAVGTAAVTAVLEKALGAPRDVLLVRAYDGDVPAHPVAIRSELFERASSLQGDQGLRAIESDVGTLRVPLPGASADVDTAADLIAQRRGGKRPAT